MVTRNTLAAGRRRGRWSAIGVTASNAVQGMTAAAGLGALIVRSQPPFEAIRWPGVAYLAYLGVQAWRSAWHGDHPPLAGEATATPGQALTGFRQGFLSNITNPKVLAFYLAVLPQFVGGAAPIGICSPSRSATPCSASRTCWCWSRRWTGPGTCCPGGGSGAGWTG